jgi:hypothetical protein
VKRRITYIVLGLLFILYLLMEIYRPRQQDWSVSLSREDKEPYGSYLLYERLKDIFPKAEIASYRLPIYDQVNNSGDSNTAYLLIEPSLRLSKEDVDEMLNYVEMGNYVFMSAGDYEQALLDTLRFENAEFFYAPVDKRNGRLNFTNPDLRTDSGYSCRRNLADGYFKRFDSTNYTVLGKFNDKEINFIRINHGSGAFFIHASPLCFSNYFMMQPGKDDYTAKALSYIPASVDKIYWDEYYKKGPEGAESPLRFFLNNTMLRWALRLSFLTILLFLFFDSKRRQRVIPVMDPLRNTTLDFVNTVGGVYYNRRDNKNIALKKINYLMEFLRNKLFIATSLPADEMIKTVTRKTGMPEREVAELFRQINRVPEVDELDDASLMSLSTLIDDFYEKAQ